MTERLEGKVAAVTGAARGLGAGISKRLATEGATVICLDKEPPEKTSESINAALSKKVAIAKRLDVTDHDAVESVLGEIAEQHGSLDIMVNNAGVAHPVANLLDTADNVVEAVFAVNVFGLLACSRAAARSDDLARQGWAHNKHRVPSREKCVAGLGSVLGLEGVRHQPHAVPGPRAGTVQHHCKRNLPWHHDD